MAPGNAAGREIEAPYVTLQTGEQPDDRFFDRGRIIVTMYDQLLSGRLCGQKLAEKTRKEILRIAGTMFIRTIVPDEEGTETGRSAWKWGGLS